MTRILLCDDESIQRAALRLCLERLPNLSLPITEIREAVHGRQALELIDEFSPDIIFLDLRMPVMGGLEAAENIKRRLPSARIIILTAYDEFNFAQEAIQIGVCDYLLKPASQAELARVMQKAMAELTAEREQQQQLQMLRQRVEAARPLILQEYMGDLLSGRSLQESEMEERRRFLELPGHPHAVIVLELTDFLRLTKGQSEGERQMLKEQVMLIMEREVRQPPALIRRLGNNRMALLLAAADPLAEKEARCTVVELANRIWQAVNKELQLPVSIGIGRTVTDPLQLHQSYSDAIQAVCCQAILGSNQVIHIDDVDQGTAGQSLSREEEELLQAMRLGDRKQTMARLETLLVLLERQDSQSLEALRWRLLELLVLLTRAAILGGASSEQVTRINIRHLAELTQVESARDLRQILAQATGELLNLVLSERVMRHQRLVKKALAHMEQHYHEQLTLEDVARVVYLSPFYFSHVLKEQTGMTFVQYLTELRLAAAKQLLRQTELPIGQIAEQVGYNDVSYFSRVFKRQISLTPSEYRNRLGDVN